MPSLDLIPRREALGVDAVVDDAVDGRVSTQRSAVEYGPGLRVGDHEIDASSG
jgi:hypothetical protein